MNLPAYLVVVKGTEFFDALQCRFIDYPITDVLQMMGRAGRPQFDSEGVACVMVHDIKKNYYKKFLYEPFPVESSLHKHLHDHINAEIAAGNLHSLQDVVDYISWTFFYRRLLANPSYYGLYGNSVEEFQSFLLTILLGVLQDLQSAGCIELKENNQVSPKRLGIIASFYYIQYTTVHAFAERLREIDSIPSLLQLISAASEYDPAPLRHNEDQTLEAFANEIYWSLPDDANFNDQHLKVYMLLQAFMQRLPLPITDFLNDQNSILDNSIRLINALADIAFEIKQSSQLLLIMNTMPLLIQALMPYNSQLLQIDGIDNALVKRLNKEGICELRDLRGKSETQILEILNHCRCERKLTEKVENC